MGWEEEERALAGRWEEEGVAPVEREPREVEKDGDWKVDNVGADVDTLGEEVVR